MLSLKVLSLEEVRGKGWQTRGRVCDVFHDFTIIDKSGGVRGGGGQWENHEGWGDVLFETSA